ncbi:MAG TPA: ATP-binding protein [Clostridia bacterium]|nr:ATP-binding protein [Clostridia bacterium]
MAAKIAVLSGKGGTGKTLVSVNLALAANKAVYVDCDVEEPNGHLFFKPTTIKKEDIFVKIPSIDKNLCTGCKKCVEFCKFNALAYAKELIVFDEVCHSCGGCVMICPQKALNEKDKFIGTVKTGISENVKTITGELKTGEASGVPIIKNLLNKVKDEKELVFIDCPPGSACTVMESIADADFCLLVAEPTVFGSHNLEMVYELIKVFKKPCAVVLNKTTQEKNPSEEFCIKNGIIIFQKIPFDQELGELNSNGKIAVRENYSKKSLFYDLLDKVREAVK